MAVDDALVAVFGPKPDYINLDEQTTTSYDVTICTFYALAVATVALRFYVRSWNRSPVGADDWTILVSLICTGCTVFTAILAGTFNAGYHIWATTLSRFITLSKIVYAEPYVYATAVTSTKASILLLYRRLFYVQGRSDATFTSILLGVATFFTLIYPIILWVTMACACRPVSYFWLQYTGTIEGKCIDVYLFYLILGIVNMLNDIFILIVPIPKVWKLQMSRRKRISVISIMLLGGIVCVASILRIWTLNNLADTTDATWWIGPGMAWSALEPSLAIISACLPTYSPFFRWAKSKAFPGGHAKGEQYGNSGGAWSGSRSPAALGNTCFNTPSTPIPLTSWKETGNNTYIHAHDDEVQLTSCSLGSGIGSIGFGSGIRVKHQIHITSQ